jgi:pimeloyl-ACP methyl ester carboxylesterase
MIRSLGTFVALCALLVAPALGARAQAPAVPADLVGDWSGLLQTTTGAKVRLVFHIRGDGPSTMDSPDQGASGLPVKTVSENGGQVSVVLGIGGIHFDAPRGADPNVLTGQFHQGEAAIPLTLTHAALSAAPHGPPPPADLVGDWWGVLAAPGGIELHFAFHVRADGASTFDSPDQNVSGVQLAGVSEDAGKVRIDLKPGVVFFEGQRSADSALIDGQFHQGPAAFAMKLQRGLLPALNRPQTPKPPFPYRAEEVGYDNTVQHVHLAGTLTLPEGKGPYPVVLLITGSGQQDRDEALLGHKPFLVLADYLSRRGIAVLRVDDRGIGGSTGDFAASTTADFATDVEAGVAYLKSRPDIDHRHIGLVGHSEGGVIAPMVAANDPSVAFIVMMAGSGVPGDQILLYQERDGMEAAGMAPDKIAENLAVNRKIFDLIESDVDAATARREIVALLAPQLKAAGQPPQAADQAAAAFTSPWIRWFAKYDPAPALRRVRCPVLAIGGSKDVQVPVKINLPAIREALKHNPDATVEELPGLNHLFQTAGTGQPNEYAKIEETISPTALKVIGDWIAGHDRK